MNPSLRGKRILVVEDEFVTGELLRRCIEGAGGIAIGPASTAEAAIDLAVREQPHAVLLDVSLLAGSSVQVVRHLKASGVPYAVLTGHAAASLPAELQAALCLEKPIAPGPLVAVLAGLVSG
ncbi:MAG TPA: response regulator [Reyranella sp.]|jgi:DNA-binding response OmpR family regulator|nr:response regulator [Reyranella sp.]